MINRIGFVLIIIIIIILINYSPVGYQYSAVSDFHKIPSINITVNTVMILFFSSSSEQFVVFLFTLL